MDSFSIIAFFTKVDDVAIVQPPTNEETGGGGSNGYCVVSREVTEVVVVNEETGGGGSNGYCVVA
jgi:hypothetical protein